MESVNHKNTFQSGGGEQSIAQGEKAIGTQINNYYAPPQPENKPQPTPAVQTGPPTVIVDAMHRGDYVTITEALNAAKPSTRILVRLGLYRESLVIDKPVEIVGDGKRDDIVIEAADNDVIFFQTDIGRIANLTLRQTGSGEPCCVNIAQGRLDIEDCDISSQSFGCVLIHGSADPRLRRCCIHDGKGFGIVVAENGKGLLEDNYIFANEEVGVAIGEGGNPTLRRNRIHDGKGFGVVVAENGKGLIEENDIFANEDSGIMVRTGGNPTLRRNRIHDGKSSGVDVYENGQGLLEDNDIFANENAGVWISKGGNPTLRRNRIHDGKASGIVVTENGKGLIKDNDIFANEQSGVAISEGGNLTLRGNRIHDGEASGVFVYNNGQGTAEDNEIFANKQDGVLIGKGGSLTLRRNRITQNGDKGIYVSLGGGGIFENNDLRDNANGAWRILLDRPSRVQRSGNIE